jgi:MFS family permease
VQTPAGALTDISHAKRAIIAAAAVVVTGASILLPFTSSFVFVAGSQAAADAAAAFFGPAIAAITLGIIGPRAFTRRIGRNESFNHAGNAFAAAVAEIGAWRWGPIVVFYLVASMALLSIVSVLTIRAEAIDHDRARGLHHALSESQEKPSSLGMLIDSQRLMIFCLCCVIFHLANAAMLPLVGQKLALQDENEGHRSHVGLYRRGAGRHGADGRSRRPQGRYLGPKASLSGRIGDPVSARFSLPIIG